VLVLLAGSAGLRRGEIQALKWTDLDIARKLIKVERALWRGIEGTPKSGKGRVVPMTGELAGALTKHRHLVGERVLYSERGTAMSNRSIRNWLMTVFRRAGIGAEGAANTGAIHKLRHTFCSHLAAAGVPAKAIQELAGHADLKTTLRYMHLAPGDREGAMRALAGYYAKDASTTCALSKQC
jgi:integrase